MSNLSEFINYSKDVFFKNLLINGGFDIWERGDSKLANVLDYSADRWKTQFAVNKTTDGLSFVSTDSNYGLNQGIELPLMGKAGQFFIGQKLAVSFNVKSNATNKNFHAGLAFRDVSGASQNQVSAATSLNFIVGTTKTKYVGTFTIDDVPVATNVCLDFVLLGDDATYEISDVQLELGSTPTEFEKRPLTIEQKLCYRYFYAWNKNSKFLNNYGGGSGAQGWLKGEFHFPVKMRVKPTFAGYQSSAAYIYTPTNTYIDQQGGMIFVRDDATLNGASLGGIKFDAEL